MTLAGIVTQNLRPKPRPVVWFIFVPYFNDEIIIVIDSSYVRSKD